MKLIKPIRRIRPIRLVFSLLLAIVLAGAGFYFFTKPAVAAWMDENWLYRQAIPISAHTAAETNVYIVVTVDTSSTSNFQAHCEDVRFTQADGKILPYYLFTDTCRNPGNSVFHVFLATFPAGAQTIYVYYGNPSAPKGGSSADFTTLASNYTVGTLASAENSPGPVAYWKFDDGQGQTALDSSSSKNNGTITGATWTTEDLCISGKCLFFDGSTSYVDTGNAASLTRTTALTIEAWVKPNSVTGYVELVTKPYSTDWSSPYASYMLRLDNNSKLALYIATGGSFSKATANTALVNNVWQHIVVAWDGTTAKFYLNGAADGTPALSGTIQDPNNKNLLISGNALHQEPYKGFIDDVKIYPYARTAAQIKTDYNAGAKAAATKSGAGAVLGSKPQDWMSNGLVGYWKMDESSWSGTSADVLDASGNSNNGTASCAGVGCTKPAGGAAGKFGNAGSFDGTEDYVDAGEGAGKLDGMSSITVGAWINPQSSTEDVIIAVGKGGSYPDQYSYTLGMDMPSGNLYLDLQNSLGVRIYYDTGVTVPLNTWNHIVMTWDNANVRGYINGVAVGLPQTLVGGVVKDSTANLRIGYFQYAAADWFKGSIDEVRIYNRALSSKEVSDLYNWAPGPVGYWNFEEGTGTAVNDKSGYGNNGSWAGTGTKHWDVGKIGTAGKFNGTDDYVQILDSDSLDVSNAMTIILTVNKTSSADAIPLYKNTTYGIEIGNRDVWVNLIGAGGWWFPSPAVQITLNTPQQIAFTYDGVTKALYVQGILKASAAQTGAVTKTTGNLLLGANSISSTYWYQGLIDEVRVYNYARTPAQILADYGTGLAQKQPMVYLKMDEGQGTTANNSGTQGQALQGTVNSGTWTNSGKFGKGVSITGSSGSNVSVPDFAY